MWSARLHCRFLTFSYCCQQKLRSVRQLCLGRDQEQKGRGGPGQGLGQHRQHLRFPSTRLRFAVLIFRLFGWFSLASKQGPVCTVKSRSARSWHVDICGLLRKVSNQFQGFRSGLGQKVLAAGPLELHHCSRSWLSLTTSSRREMFYFPSAFSHSRVSLCEGQAREMIWRRNV